MPEDQAYPFDDKRDFDDAGRGFIAALSPGVVRDAAGKVVWDNDSYAFLDGDAPDTADPSLWRQSALNARQGLFAVTEDIYQVRGALAAGDVGQAQGAGLTLDGDPAVLKQILGVLQPGDPAFNIIEP